MMRVCAKMLKDYFELLHVIVQQEHVASLLGLGGGLAHHLFRLVAKNAVPALGNLLRAAPAVVVRLEGDVAAVQAVAFGLVAAAAAGLSSVEVQT